MKTGKIIGISAGGVLGALLLGGTAFAAEAATSDEVRSERAASMVAEDTRDQQMRGEGPREGFERPHDAERGEGMGRGDRGHSGDSERERSKGHERMGDRNGDRDRLREGPGHAGMHQEELEQEPSLTP